MSVYMSNDVSKSWVVHKYGGTAVGKYAREIAGIVKNDLSSNRVAIVCSARSTSTKSEGTTNKLLRAAKEAECGHSKTYEDIVASIRDDHIKTAEANITSEAIQACLLAEIDEECNDLSNFLAAVQKIQEITPRSLDIIIGKGEILSCRFMAALLRDNGVNADFVDLSNLLNVRSTISVDQIFFNSVITAIRTILSTLGAQIPVITGYFGTVPGGLLSQVGRGYTDLCAALLSVSLAASELQVWKEVDGIFSADPRKVSTARLLSTITPLEAAELTFWGSEVIHPFTMEQAIRARIPIRIRNVTNPLGSGTKIVPDPSDTSPRRPTFTASTSTSLLFRPRSSGPGISDGRAKRPTAVTIKHNILIMNIHSNKRSLSHDFFARIFSTLDRWRLSVDLISTSEVHVSMALHSENALVHSIGSSKEVADLDLQGALADLAEVGNVDLIDEMAILALVGREMKNMTGIAGKMFSVLGDHNVNIEMISQGASEINISCVIAERDSDRALNVLHTNLFTFLD